MIDVLRKTHPIPRTRRTLGRILAAALLLADPLATVVLWAAKPSNVSGEPRQGRAAKSETPQAVSTDDPSADARFQRVTYEKGLLRVQMDKSVPYRIFSLTKPPRLVVELSGTRHDASPYEATVDDGVLKRIRSAQFQSAPEKITRVVLDVARMVPYEAEREGNDLLVRLTGSETATVPSAAASSGGPATAMAAELPAAVRETTPPHKSPLPASLEGEVSESVTAAAAPEKKPKKSRSKNLLEAIPTHPVTVDFDNADIRDVVRVLSEMSGLNMIYGTDVRGTLTIHLEQVPLNEAFNTILAMNGLVAQQMGDNIIRILTPETLSADRSRSVTTYKTYTLNYAKAAEVAPHLASVRISPNASITVDVRSNTLVITDTPEGLARAERMIADLDKKPQQVMIEARIVEIVLSDNLDLGIQWEYANVKNQPGQARAVGIRETKIPGSQDADSGSIGFTSGSGGLRSNPAGVAPESNVSAKGPGSRGTGVALPGPQNVAISFGFINNTDLLTMTLNALAQKGQTKILSAPKIITVNNKEAKIQSGAKIPFSITTVAATGVATQSFQFVDVGIILTVTPTISADDRIRLNVHPEVAFPGAVGPAGPEINTRNADTEVLIRDGETLVIGGLIDEQMREAAQKVPLLGDIPVLGAFFRSTSDSKRRSELLVFVTPTIIRE